LARRRPRHVDRALIPDFEDFVDNGTAENVSYEASGDPLDFVRARRY